jgi:cation diffusion facilitator CzcD-associated flavoprotein CzcO
MANPPNPVRSITQFARQAQYLSERENPVYSPAFKATMRYVPLAMRLYRFKHYLDMERDYAGFNIESGRPIRQSLATENAAYVKKMAPRKYWDALIPTTEIGCKRKVLDTEYLKSLWQDNVELVSDDAVEKITENGVVTKSGREVRADAVVLAIGFATQQMLCPMEIVGKNGVGLGEYVSSCPHPYSQAKTEHMLYIYIYERDGILTSPTVENHNTRRRTSLFRHRGSWVSERTSPLPLSSF